MRSSVVRMRSILVRMRSSLVVRASDCQATIVATVLGSIPASVGTVESEGRQMKQCWIQYEKKFHQKIFKKKFSRVPMPSIFVAEPAPGPLQGPADGGVGRQDGLTQEEDDGQDHSSTHRHTHPLSRHRVPSGQKVHHQLFLLFLRWYAQSNNYFLCWRCKNNNTHSEEVYSSSSEWCSS